MNLDDLLRIVPGLRRWRSINARDLGRLLSREPWECIWCGMIVPKRRRSWCSDECVHAFRSRCDSAYAARIVTEAARGICAICGVDTIAAEQIRRYSICFARGRWREVDHVVPVCEGGGLCGPLGLRLLCGACHAKESDALAERRRIARRKMRSENH